MKIQHHIKYKEIDGIDEIEMIEKGEHHSIHHKNRKNGLYNISVNELKKISQKAHHRTEKYKNNRNKFKKINNFRFIFIETLITNIQFIEEINYSILNNSFSFSSFFKSKHDKKLYDIGCD